MLTFWMPSPSSDCPVSKYLLRDTLFFFVKQELKSTNNVIARDPLATKESLLHSHRAGTTPCRRLSRNKTLKEPAFGGNLGGGGARFLLQLGHFNHPSTFLRNQSRRGSVHSFFQKVIPSSKKTEKNWDDDSNLDNELTIRRHNFLQMQYWCNGCQVVAHCGHPSNMGFHDTRAIFAQQWHKPGISSLSFIIISQQSIAVYSCQ